MIFHLLVTLGLACLASGARAFDYNPSYLATQNCKTCDAMSCPELIYCAGQKVKDDCGCCERCSSDLFQPHVPAARGFPASDAEDQGSDVAAEPSSPQGQPTVDACEERQCPRFKVCMINVQGLPICTCPSELVCDPRRKKKPEKTTDMMAICGSDGVTYESRCHMRVANCVKGRRIRRKHSGACLAGELPPLEDSGKLDKLPDTLPDQATTELDTVSKEDRERLKAVQKVKRRKQRRKKLKERRKKKKGKKGKKSRNKRRRMKRRNNGYSLYSSRYSKLIGRNTKWGRSQVRKSRI